MKKYKEKIIDILAMMVYFAFSCFSIEFFSISKYDWMLASGENICSIPHQSLNNRILQSCIAAFFLITPLLIALLRNIYIGNRYKIGYYGCGLLAVALYGIWVFFGRFMMC